MTNEEFFKHIYSRQEPDDPWYKFYDTRDWYDIPESIRNNSWLYPDLEAVQKKRHSEFTNRFCIYPKDVEVIYGCTPDLARSFLDDIRTALDLPVTGPVTYVDFEKYTQLDLQTIHDFIWES